VPELLPPLEFELLELEPLDIFELPELLRSLPLSKLNVLPKPCGSELLFTAGGCE
jgi:hypothetical protein